MTNIRYKYLPQMEEYDFLGQDFVLYSMFTQKKLFAGKHISTDKFGFRYSKYKDKKISIESELDTKEKINILIGGSSVFGVGASNDDKTITSCLSNLTGEKWLNLGIRAANSFQEYTSLLKILNRYENIGNIIFMSGINDVYLNLSIANQSQIDDPIFGGLALIQNLEDFGNSRYSLKRKAVAGIIATIKNVKLSNLIHLKSINDMFRFKKIPREENKAQTFDNLSLIFDRNFLLYSSLNELKIGNTKVSFFLQPFFNWVDKKHNKKEHEIFNFLENVQKNEQLLPLRKIDKKLHKRVIQLLNKSAKKYNFSYTDLNRENFGDKKDFVFVDRVHMSDKGNQIIAELIKKYTYPKIEKL